jgi:hypothetical protein
MGNVAVLLPSAASGEIFVPSKSAVVSFIQINLCPFLINPYQGGRKCSPYDGGKPFIIN